MVDDDEDDRIFFQDALIESGYNHELRFAINGKDLMQQLNEIQDSGSQKLPDLIFLDLNMPLRDGREVLKAIRSTPAYSLIPVFIYTTSSSDHDVNLCYSNGANLYITKPSNFHKIVQMIKAVCDLVDKHVILPQLSVPKKK